MTQSVMTDTPTGDGKSWLTPLDRALLVFDDAPSALAVCDSAGILLDVNKAFCGLVSRTAPELLGMRFSELVDPADRDEFSLWRDAILSGAPEARIEVSLLQRPGSTRRSVLRLKRTNTTAGDTLVILDAVDLAAARSDDDARRTLSEVLRQVALEWTETFDAVEMPIVMIDTGLRVRRLNRAAARTAGGEFRNILQKRIDSLGPGEPWQTATRLAQRTLEEGKPQTMEAHDEAAGMYWDVSASVANVNTPGDERIVVTARNVTAIRTLQESVRRAEVLSALGSLVAGVAHEVRNPLFGVSATFEAFAAEHRDLPSLGEYLVAFRRDLRRLKQLMNDLLEYGKPSSLILSQQPLAPIIHQAVSVCEALAAERGVTVAVDLPDHPHVNVEADRIVVVFKNLIENALAFSPRGGVVNIRTSLTATNDRRWISCSVEDSGPGFAPADLTRIFEPFYSRRAGGTGFGLALVQRIVTDHGGTVAATNCRGAGALMTVMLPAVTES